MFNNFPHIEDALSKSEFNNLVLDGEIMSDDFQALMKQVYRKSGAETDDAYLALFDLLPLDEFNNHRKYKQAIASNLYFIRPHQCGSSSWKTV